MSPRVGATLENWTTEVSAYTPAIAVPTPSRAVTSGRPAASSDPKVTASTSTATRTPTASVADCSTGTWNASPPISTCRPAASATSVDALRASRSASVRSVASTV